MEVAAIDELVRGRFREKCAMLGGAKVGYVLRREALRAPHPELDDEALSESLAGLVDQGVLAVNEEGSIYFLTEAGVGWLDGLDPEAAVAAVAAAAAEAAAQEAAAAATEATEATDDAEG